MGMVTVVELIRHSLGPEQAEPGFRSKMCGKWKGRTSETSWKASCTAFKLPGWNRCFVEAFQRVLLDATTLDASSDAHEMS